MNNENLYSEKMLELLADSYLKEIEKLSPLSRNVFDYIVFELIENDNPITWFRYTGDKEDIKGTIKELERLHVFGKRRGEQFGVQAIITREIIPNDKKIRFRINHDMKPIILKAKKMEKERRNE